MKGLHSAKPQVCKDEPSYGASEWDLSPKAHGLDNFILSW